MKTYGIGVVGCGNISDIYLKNITQLFPTLTLIGVSDLDSAKAEHQASTYDTKVYTTDELLHHPDVDIILNITTPKTHRTVSEAALKAGKHVYVEKPLALNAEDGRYLLQLAKENNLHIGGAPDTFLGAGIQTCKKIIEDGWIGDIIGCNANLVCHGHEHWHPDPEFYYDLGGGPMFDMGPYYLTALVYLIGSVDQVAGMNGKSFDTRTITSEKKRGQTIDVKVMTHVTSLLHFENNAIGYITTSFDVWGSNLPCIEIYGTEGTLSVPDPNTFDGPVKLLTHNDPTFREIPLCYDYRDNSRGLGLHNMAMAIDRGTRPAANGALTYHVLEIMESIHNSWETNSYTTINSRL